MKSKILLFCYMDIFAFIGIIVSIISLFIGIQSRNIQIKESKRDIVKQRYSFYKDEAQRLENILSTKKYEEKDYRILETQKNIIKLFLLISKMTPISYDKKDIVQLRYIVQEKATALKSILELFDQLQEEFKIIGNRLIPYISQEAQIRIRNGNFKFSYFKDKLLNVLTDVLDVFKKGNYYAALRNFDSYFNCTEFLDELQIVNDFCLAYFDALSNSMDKESNVN